MWPFTSGAGKETEELSKELPENLKEFFAEANPAKGRFEGSPKDEQVDRILAQQNQQYTHEFARYKREELLKKVATINCSELQQAVIDCYQGWLLISANHCSDEIKRAMKCMDVQSRAFKQLRYENCFSEKQCQLMRYVVDKLFTKNFGQFGEHMNEETQLKFDADIDDVFGKVWK